MNSLVAFGVLVLVAIVSFEEVLGCSKEIESAVNTVAANCFKKDANGQRPHPNEINKEEMAECLLNQSIDQINLQNFVSECSKDENFTATERMECIHGKLKKECPELMSQRPNDSSEEEDE